MFVPRVNEALKEKMCNELRLGKCSKCPVCVEDVYWKTIGQDAFKKHRRDALKILDSLFNDLYDQKEKPQEEDHQEDCYVE